MSRKLTSHEIELLKARGIGSNTSPRGRLLSVLALLLDYSDSFEGITAKEISRVLGECSGVIPAENTIRLDLMALAASKPLGIRMEMPKKGDNHGYRITERLVDPDEAILLLDLVNTCKFVTENQCKELEGKLRLLVPESKQNEVDDTVVVADKENDKSSDVLLALNTASRAIKEKKQISFRYRRHRLDGSYEDSELHTENPIALVFSFGHYYLKTIHAELDESERKSLLRRLDHMKQVSIPGQKVTSLEIVDQIKRETPSQLREMIDMMGDGVTRTLFLKVEGRCATPVYDRFGHDLKFEYLKQSSKSSTGYACIRVQLSQTFYRWVFGMSGGVIVVKPKSLNWCKRFWRSAPRSEKGFNDLLGDYEQFLTNYMKMLHKETELYA